jgi:hypothetical protein
VEFLSHLYLGEFAETFAMRPKVRTHRGEDGRVPSSFGCPGYPGSV